MFALKYMQTRKKTHKSKGITHLLSRPKLAHFALELTFLLEPFPDLLVSVWVRFPESRTFILVVNSM
jgi:hypothetical protein